MRLLISICILTFFLVTKGFGQSEFLSGLYFASTEVVQDQRTSLDLTPEAPINLTTNFKLEFDIQLREGDGNYGYIFRVIANSTDNFDLISNFSAARDNFSLVFKDEILCSFAWKDLPNLGYGKWVHIVFKLDLKGQQVEIAIDENTKTSPINYPHVKADFDFLFGVSKYDTFESTDVCPMSLKNIRICDHRDRVIRNWELAKHLVNQVYDEIEKALALVENPTWLIDKHLVWNKILDVELDNFYGSVYDETSGNLYLVDDGNIIQYNLDSYVLDTITSLSGSPYRQSSEKHLVYNPFANEIWSYNFGREEISRFDFETRQWSESPKRDNESGFAHHNKLISPVDSSLITLFGYGFYRYKSTLFNYHPSTKKWNRTDKSDQVSPRYLAATGFLNDENLLVFGGYGSKTGRQELSPGYFNDLYVLNLKSLSFEKRLTYDLLKSPFVPGESLILAEDSSSFYTLIFDNSKFKTSIQLAKFGLTEPSQTIYQDSIPFDFLDTDSWLNLYLNGSRSQLVALTNHNANLSLYAIAYPPLTLQDVHQDAPAADYRKYLSWILAVIFVVLGSVFGFLLFQRRKQKKPTESEKSTTVFNDQHFKTVARKEQSSIHFLGGFQIYNESGVDVTSGFSPTLKQLFLIIFFYTLHHRKGISSVKLDETLWFDKSEKSARNNRNVNISKLRTAIDEVGGLEIVNENLYWKFKIDTSVYCDYLNVLNLVAKSKEQDLNLEELVALTGLLDYGELLPNIQVEWIDPFKAHFTNEVIDVLVKILDYSNLAQKHKVLLHVADNIFALDPINEDALMIKCRILHQVGKGSMARTVFNSFCKEYKRLLNTEYPVLFNDILEEK